MTDILSNVVAFVFALGVIIFFHELGHLLVAKLFGVRVLTFSLGFGKRLWGFERGGTEYRVSLVPLGGYVRLGGENPEEYTGEPDEFFSKPRWQRILIYLAGPAMNVVLSILLLAVVFMVGTELGDPTRLPAVLGAVAENSPAERAGLATGDRILEIDGEVIDNWQQVHMEVVTSPERPLAVEYRRGDEVRTTTLVPDRVPRYDVGDAGFMAAGKVVVAQIVADSPAEAAGLEAGDEIRAVDERPIALSQEFIELIEARAGQPVAIDVVRQGRPVRLDVTPREQEGVGKIGALISYSYFQRFGPGEALVQSVRTNVDIVRQTFLVLGKIFTGQLAAKSALSGPIEIAAMSGRAARRGFNDLLYLMGLISISIGILNLLPVPVLDGGQITILLLEGIRQRDFSLRTKDRINQVGFVLIVLLMVTVLYFDLVKNLPLDRLFGSD